jgi:hypothetical protein
MIARSRWGYPNPIKAAVLRVPIDEAELRRRTAGPEFEAAAADEPMARQGVETSESVRSTEREVTRH